MPHQSAFIEQGFSGLYLTFHFDMNLRLDVKILCIQKLWCSAHKCNKNSCCKFLKTDDYCLLIRDHCRAREWEHIKTLLGRIQDSLGPIGKCKACTRDRLQDNAKKTALC